MRKTAAIALASLKSDSVNIDEIEMVSILLLLHC